MEKCPLCNHKIFNKPFYETVQPVNENILFTSKEEAINSPTGKISMIFCDNCKLAFNKEFKINLVDYSDNYQYTLPPSHTFFQFIDDLVYFLIKEIDVRNSSVIEFGCGKGEFLNKLCQNGKNIGFGYDSSYEGPANLENPKINFYKRFYNPKKDKNKNCDFALARQTLEHILDPKEFISDMLSALNNSGSVYLETPNLNWILENSTFWDFYYEHCTYYTFESYQYLLKLFNLNIHTCNYWFDEQYISIIGNKKLPKKAIKTTDDLEKKIKLFEINFGKKKQRLIELIKDLNSKGSWFIWGAAAKGITFTNIFDKYLNEEVSLLDINKLRQNKYVPVVGRKIYDPKEAYNFSPKNILIMNKKYINEIRDSCNFWGLNVNLLCVDDI